MSQTTSYCVYIAKNTRVKVKNRAEDSCEYCLINEAFSVIGFEVDHIIPIKHGGGSDLENLAYSCAICNFYKGSDVATVFLPDRNPIRLFHPRADQWKDHFEWDREGMLIAKSPVGAATIKVLKLNQPERFTERHLLIKAKLYPWVE
jgi:hypothetical protein